MTKLLQRIFKLSLIRHLKVTFHLQPPWSMNWCIAVEWSVLCCEWMLEAWGSISPEIVGKMFKVMNGSEDSMISDTDSNDNGDDSNISSDSELHKYVSELMMQFKSNYILLINTYQSTVWRREEKEGPPSTPSSICFVYYMQPNFKNESFWKRLPVIHR